LSAACVGGGSVGKHVVVVDNLRPRGLSCDASDVVPHVDGIRRGGCCPIGLRRQAGQMLKYAVKIGDMHKTMQDLATIVGWQEPPAHKSRNANSL